MSRKPAFTLIEILVSLVLTLMMMASVVTLFGIMSDSVSGSRSIIEMQERLRACRNRIQLDLQGATVGIVQPIIKPEEDRGYFEYIEGPVRDLDWMAFVPTANGAVAGRHSMFGDVDDVVMFTVRSPGEPFVGKFVFAPGGMLESPLAEVAYFIVPNGPVVDAAATGGTPGPTRLYTLYRRVLLVYPAARGGFGSVASDFFDNNDISIHFEGSNAQPNTLGDLTKRENRFAHYGAFPFNLNAAAASPQPTNNSAYLAPFQGGRLGDDVLMTNVLAFDVQVYDPNVPLKQDTSTPPIILTPTDKGFSAGTIVPGTPSGAYADLGYPDTSTPTPAQLFSATAERDIAPPIVPPPTPRPLAPTLPYLSAKYGGPTNQMPSPLGLTRAITYDTWSTHYEYDGQSQYGTSMDTGANGLDDDGNGIVDEPAEADCRPPFASQIRGIKIIVRAYEPSSQQVREVSIEQDFLPE